jgi:hypothetical protein
MKNAFVILLFLIIFYSCKHKRQENIQLQHINDTVLASQKFSVIDSLNKYKNLDSCEFFYENEILKTGYFLNNNIKYGLVCINEYKLFLFEYQQNRWNLIKELDYEMPYRGFTVDDINGDKINDLLFPYLYVYGNRNFLVFCQNNNKLEYNADFGGIMNPEYDTKTGYINSCYGTNHSNIEKSTYKFIGKRLLPNEKVVLEGAGIEDVEKNDFVIKFFIAESDSFKLKSSTKYNNVNKAFEVFDKSLFNTSDN